MGIEITNRPCPWNGAVAKGNYNRKGASKKSGNGLATVVGGPLNPDWCEWVMGFPIGWSASAPLATDRFQRWLLAHGKH